MSAKVQRATMGKFDSCIATKLNNLHNNTYRYIQTKMYSRVPLLGCKDNWKLFWGVGGGGVFVFKYWKIEIFPIKLHDDII